MNAQNDADAAKRVKNFAAVLYMIVLTFLVGGTYIHQQRASSDTVESQANRQ